MASIFQIIFKYFNALRFLFLQPLFITFGTSLVTPLIYSMLRQLKFYRNMVMMEKIKIGLFFIPWNLTLCLTSSLSCDVMLFLLSTKKFGLIFCS